MIRDNRQGIKAGVVGNIDNREDERLLGVRTVLNHVLPVKLNYYTFLEPKGLLAELKKHLFLRALGFKYRRLKSSTLQSLERGQKTEVDYLTGFITAHAKKFNIPTPVNDQVYQMIKDIEQGKTKISPANLDRILI